MKDMERDFSTHAVNEMQVAHMQALRDSAKELATMIEAMVPEGREKSLAYTRVEEAVFWANAGISRNGKE